MDGPIFDTEKNGVDAGDLEFMINHVFLPPKLPQLHDTSATGELALIRTLYCSLQEFSNLEPVQAPKLQAVTKMVGRLLRLETGGSEQTIITDVLTELDNGESAVFYVRNQNAGLLLTGKPDCILAQGFELLSQNSSVMSCKGRLIRQFPDVASEFPRAYLHDQKLVGEFVDVLYGLITSPIMTVRPKTRKANQDHDETRDTVSPILVTGMLVGVLSGLPGAHRNKPVAINKRMKEHVSWDNSKDPFHRSPLWVLLRVSIQMVLYQTSMQESTHLLYKAVLTFYHATLLRKAVEIDLDSDLRFTMSAKLLRRITKLNPTKSLPWVQKVQEILHSNHDGLKSRWLTIQEHDKRSISLHPLKNLCFDDDCKLRLKQLNTHLDRIRSRSSANVVGEGPGDDTKLPETLETEFPRLSHDSEMLPFSLLNFEAWVDQHLDSWVHSELANNNRQHDRAALSLHEMESNITSYLNIAQNFYAKDPEALSLMHLVIMEIWVAMDRLAAHSIPLLLDYDPGFPSTLLHPLILPTSRQMERLKMIEQYLMTRRRGRYLPMFGNFGQGSSFAVRYFDASLPGEHRSLHGQIVSAAEENKRQKSKEYREKSQQHAMLKSKRERVRHEKRYWGRRWDCIRDCTACDLDMRMKDITIKKFEWPLPAQMNQAKAVVFEIDVPDVVRLWRNITVDIFLRLLVESSDIRTSSDLYYPTDHSGLRDFTRSTSCIQLASVIKPLERSHYANPIHIGQFTNESEVFAEHGCRYDYYQRGEKLEAWRIFQMPRIHDRCSHASHEPNAQLSQWIRRSCHTSNHIIAALDRCSLDMSLEEFKAFGHLRAGDSIQWANTLGQLAMPSLDLNRHSTFLLIMQACTEAGPRDTLGSVHRKFHIDTAVETFDVKFLGALEDAFARICKNWQNETALGLFACLATRILSLSDSCHVSKRALELLAHIRATSMMWTQDLLSKRANSTADDEREVLAQRAYMASVICMSTFDIISDLLRQVLSSPDELSRFVEAAIIARDHLPIKIPDPIPRILTYRWRSVMHRSMAILREEITERRNPGLGSAIQHFWADYSPSPTGWSARQGTRNHVLESSVSRPGKITPVTWNMLTGQLLVNGYPLSRLPQNFELDPSYSQLFGTRVLEVMPSTYGNMHFSASRDQEGWIVHFSMIDGRLVTQAVKCQSSIVEEEMSDEDLYEFIPRSHFKGDLPATFVKGFSHWRNMRTGDVEFRPAAKPWNHSPGHWTLVCDGAGRVLRQGRKSVVDPDSETANALWARFKPLDSKENLDIIFHQGSDGRRLEINLPRFSLTFSLVLGESSLRSKHYAGMVVDDCQEIGTLVGLRNKLVLCDEHSAQNLSPSRLVLIPHGQATVGLSGHHVTVEISMSDQPQIRHDAFKVDNRLGRLIDGGSLTSKLYLCLLHGLSSHCLPDPLTERTGTEEALRILQSAAVRSFQRLDSTSITLLTQISNLSPKRAFYPTHLKDMEQCDWNPDLPVLSQHDGFRAAVDKIIAHAQDCELFYESDQGDNRKKINDLAKGVRSNPLFERAIIRNSIFRVSEFGAESYSPGHDITHRGRLAVSQSNTAQSISSLATASLVHSETPRLLFPITSSLRTTILSTTGQTFAGNPDVDLQFSSEYFADPQHALMGLWCGLHRVLATEKNPYRVIFFLSSLTFATEASLDLIQALMAIGTHRAKFGTAIVPPNETSFNLTYDNSSLLPKVDRIVRDACYDMTRCPEYHLTRRTYESERDFEDRRYNQWSEQSYKMREELVLDLKSQWSQAWTVSRVRRQRCEDYIDVNVVMKEVNETLDLTRRTNLFSDYLDSLVAGINSMSSLTSYEDGLLTSRSHIEVVEVERPPCSQTGFIKDSSLFSHQAPQTRRPVPEKFSDLLQEVPQIDAEQKPISSLIEHLSDRGTQEQHHISYIKELRQSSESPGTAQLRFNGSCGDPAARLSRYLVNCEEEAKRIQTDILMVLSGSSVTEKLCSGCSFYPRVSPIFLLQRLRRNMWREIPAPWRVCLVNYALSLAYLQRAERLVNSHGFANRKVDFLKELRNFGHHDSHDCDPLDYPEDLLLEVEQGILIRPVQHQIAAHMRNPPDGQSSVMQLNMGEGKSSVIVPIVSTAIADGTRLARVVVAKPQANQMNHTLVGAISGLLHRPVFYLPISRAVRCDNSGIAAVGRMIQECKKEGGVLLVQPEHILSFKLMGLEAVWNRLHFAEEIVQTYRELENMSRDIVDESDENFSVKFELIYTMGSQRPVDMSPDRWVLVQDLMGVVRDVARELKLGDGNGSESTKGLLFEEEPSTGRFPTIRTLDEPTSIRLLKATAHKVCSQGIRGLPIHHQTTEMRHAIQMYILDPKVERIYVEMVENDQSGIFGENTMRNRLLLLRGLLANGVLHFALSQKRFRVNYGLAPDRQPPTMLAVPYRAKDSPAPRSEFSHTDVVIVLTCLSYYYRGLTDEELFISLEMLSNSDRAEQEYGDWSAASPLLPPTLKHFSAVNLKDKTLCTAQIFPNLRFAKPAIDYYLSNIIFPKEMREFPFKLSSSGWDLAKPKRFPVTGFSGTIDSKYVLPISIKALDLDEQRHTNSSVLACLLQKENTVLELKGDQDDLCALTVNMLLSAVANSDQSMRVILDVGAQIIELSNLKFSRRWLKRVSDAEAVIFFNDNDELSVLSRHGKVESFYTSPFRTQMERCLVFLDQAHTRGTDLRLPDSYRAAVTLGPGITKDTLVQACMRMRKLGNGQSVTFCLSPEMQKRIRDFEGMDGSRRITVMHVLAFAISETWHDAHRSVPLWAIQGLRHLRQEEILSRVGTGGALTAEDVQDYLEDEAQTLEMRYRPVSADRQSQSLSFKLQEASRLTSRQKDVAAIRQKCVEFGLSNLDSVVTLEEEQERELAPEIEQERNVERPAPMRPLKHSLHRDVRTFAETGRLNQGSKAFLPAFQALARSSASQLFPADEFPSDLLITKDFAETVESSQVGYCSDSYLRPVQWILTKEIPPPSDDSDDSDDDEEASGLPRPEMLIVIISPHEADILKYESLGRFKGGVTLHSYLPRSSLSFRTMEDLKTFTYPPVALSALEAWTAPRELIMQLNLFAGQLYLSSYEEYVRLCRYLGLSFVANESDGTGDGEGVVKVGADGFVGRAGGEGYENCRFERSPVGFLNVLYKKLRRDCTNIDKTHVGIILAGGILTEKDFGKPGGEEQSGCLEGRMEAMRLN